MILYRVWNAINLTAPLFIIPVDSPQQGKLVIDVMANTQLDCNWITDNAFGLEVYINDEWEEWYDEDFNISVDELADIDSELLHLYLKVEYVDD
jgi:hypothetical protein